MKNKSVLLTAVTAVCITLTLLTGCEKGNTVENSDKNNGNEGEDPIELSIENQWLVSVEPDSEEAGAGFGITTHLFDINVTAEETLTIGDMNDMYAEQVPSYGIEDFNSETDFLIMDQIKDIKITRTSETSGIITGMMASTGTIGTIIEYRDLTSDSVTLTYNYSTYGCKAATTKMRILYIF